MKKAHIMPVLASLLFAAACGGGGGDGGPTAVDTRASVRFVNATTGMSGSGGFTANGQFVAGSALAPGQVAQTCSRVDAGSSIGFGASNTAGTGLSGNLLATLNNETIAAGGKYTVVAFGPATIPTLLLLTNSFSGDLGTTQAAVRFATFVPNTSTNVYNYFFYKGEVGTPPLALNMPFGGVSTFTIQTSGANIFSALRVPGLTTVVAGSTITLEPGSVNTIALVADATGAPQLVNAPRCP